MAFKRFISIFLTTLVLFMVCAPSIARMDCLKSGAVHTSFGQFESCTIDGCQNEAETISNACCDFSTISIDADLLQNELKLSFATAAILLSTFSFEDSVWTGIFGKFSASLRAPPLELGTYLALIGVYRL